MLLFVAGIILAYGIFCAFWPKIAANQFLVHFDVDSPLSLQKPSTWLKQSPGPLAFRLVGVFLIGVAGLLIRAWLNGS